MSTLISADLERINHFEWRVKRLENFIGKSDENNIVGIINDLNEKLIQCASSNMHAIALLKQADTINRIISSDFQSRLLKDRSVKLELILADEERIRGVTKILSEIDASARVLDGEYFQEIPNLFKTLNKLLTIHHDIKYQHSEFTQELSKFLRDYAAFTLMMDENLQQYKTILRKNQQEISTIEDNPIE
ncbi:unnamed protein product [Rotaria socialis]|uniref:Uncharacterized protein n=1 Tax=Rotaria socialis TaxID=392032 RepID=A0A820PPC5_9BILA|nr:unnamed protein product [Rotaria socialis]CAF3544355.1 unnamed protein product [Rotaria socialis]CAF4226135.1 unnamed protein product [Rotaria socialis]CAF4406368.1 unnamed protein product [Rotaria socialis]